MGAGVEVPRTSDREQKGEDPVDGDVEELTRLWITGLGSVRNEG